MIKMDFLCVFFIEKPTFFFQKSMNLPKVLKGLPVET